MKVLPLRDPLPGEGVVAVHPPLMPVVQERWRRRLNFYAGRALSDVALAIEQAERSGHLALLGQTLSAGVVRGLEPAIDTAADGQYFLHIAPGLGLTATGEDVTLISPLRVPLLDVRLYGAAPPPPAAEEGLLRSPVEPTLGEVFDRDKVLPNAGVFVLQPVAAEQAGEHDLTDPCERDPSADAFDDRQRIEGCRLLFCAWPEKELALPVRDDRWRNRIAYALYQAELRHGPSPVLPWLEAGLPLALAAFEPTSPAQRVWKPVFLDRHAVVRAGGKPRPRSIFLPNSGNRLLWQARVQQFAEQLAEMNLQVTPLSQAAQQFRYLPPVGLLPKDALDLPTRGFFPSYYEVDAVPVPVEQLDAAFSASAALDVFDTFVPDRVRVLVPVPEVWYEPRLLLKEAVAEEFPREVARLVQVRADRLQARWVLRQRASALVKAMTGKPLVCPDLDPDAEPTEKTDPKSEALVKEEYGTKVQVDGQGKPVLDAGGKPVMIVPLIDDLLVTLGKFNALSPGDLAELKTRGLEAYITFLEDMVRQSDNLVDLNFLRAQTDIYRIRQLMLGTVDATRLATSPALASIAQGESALATGEQIKKYYDTIRAAPPHIAPAVAEAGVAEAGGMAGAAFAPQALPTFVVHRPVGGNIFAAGERGQPLAGAKTEVGVAGVEPSRKATAAEAVIPEAAQPAKSLHIPPGVSNVVEKSPIVGEAYDFRTVTVAERLKDPPALTANGFALASKHAVVSSLANVALNLNDLPVPGVTKKGPDTTKVPATFGDIKSGAGATLLGEILRGVHDPVPEKADEAAFFTAGVRAIENTVATLHLVEGRIQAYRLAAEACRGALNDLRALVQSADRDLKVLEDKVAEARHDVAAARALLAEEQRRIAAINERRRQILAEHVTFLAFQRPRVSNVLADTPVRQLDPGLTQAPVPACLARAVAVPPELHDMVELLRQSLVKWFVYVPPLLDRLDRLDILHGTIQVAKERARTLDLSEQLARPVRAADGLLGQAIQRVYTAQERVVAQYRLSTAQLDLGVFTDQSWQWSRDRAMDLISLGDLIDGRHGLADVAQQAARELDNISRVATCLYIRCGDVAPRIRLDWAERLSQFDQPINLRILSSLPRWAEVDYLHRQEMQILTDWLYQRADAGQPDAVNLMNDLVRVCILLASHAPVSQIIAGDVARATTVRPGGRLDVEVDPGRVHVGMHVLAYADNQVVARGVVEDLGPSQAVARMTHVDGDSRGLDKGARVHFAEPEAFDHNPLTMALSR